MLRISLRGVLAAKGRFILTSLAVVIGVGFVVASLVVTDSLRASVDDFFTDLTSEIDLTVRAESNVDGFGGVRGQISPELIDEVLATEGVEAAEVTVSGYAQLLDSDGLPLPTSGAPFLGVSWGVDPRNNLATLDEGRAPEASTEVAIDRSSSEDYGLGVGDRTTVILSDASNPEVEIVGIFTFGPSNNVLGARITAFDLDTAIDLFGGGDKVDGIDVVAQPDVEQDALAERLESVLPEGVEVVTSEEVADESGSAVAGTLDVFRNVLLGFAGVALFVSAFFIHNTLSISVGQRTRQLALLQACGATPAQIVLSVVIEALLIGVVASVLGIGFGLLLASVLEALLSSAGLNLPTQESVIAPLTLVAAAVVGIGVTVASSLIPARRAAAVLPVEGIRHGVATYRMSSVQRGWSGLLLVGLGALGVAAGVWVADGIMATVLLLVAGAIGVFAGIAQLSPVVVVPFAGAVGRPLVSLLGVVGRLAHANAVRNADRTARSAAALMIGLALVTSVFIAGTSIKATVEQSIEGTIGADFVLSTADYVGFSPVVTEEVDALAEIDAVSGVRMDQFLLEGSPRQLMAVDAQVAADLLDLGVEAGSVAALDDRSILLHRDPARDRNLTVGDTVEVEMVTGGPVELTVAGIYRDATMAGNYIIEMDLLERLNPRNELDMFAMAHVAPGVDPADARAALEAVVADHPTVRLEDRSDWQDTQLAEFDQVLVAINGLLVLALFIALLGIGNTLALSVLERTREIGLLLAVGMVPGQVRRMVVVESVMVTLFGAGLGVAVGTAFGLVITAVLPDSFVSVTVIPFGTVALIVVLAAVFGTVAGLLPARRAARLNVLDAIHSP